MASRAGKPPRDIPLKNLDKVFYPATGFTKGEVIRYYRDVARWILPHLKDRPVTLVRLPDGVAGERFYAKNAPDYAPDWITTCAVARERGGGDIRYIVINHEMILRWCANLAAIELHPFLHRAPALDRPTCVAFDLDPGEGADVLTCIEVAFRIKEVLDSLGLQSFPKVSGSKGLQVYVPLNTPVDYAATKAFARALARLLEERHPRLVVSSMAKASRRGRVLIDWSQNHAAKTTVCVYSLRAKRDAPFVSMPLEWRELARARRAGNKRSLEFGPKEALARLRRRGDLFAPVLTLRQRLPRAFVAAVDRRAEPDLSAYERKRDFRKSSEPPPESAADDASGSEAAAPRFVVQKHAARNLHYDFRLELDGALKSWAVPKGLPYKLHEKRAAFEVEDHPLDYMKFEGTIPKGEYGGGTVMVWDLGTYEVVSGDPRQRSAVLRLHGKKLKGEWRIYRIRREGGKNVWLIEKHERAARPVGRQRDDRSVLTQRSMRRIAEAGAGDESDAAG